MSGTQQEFEFRSIYQDNVEAILGYALRRVPVDEASDVVTETFLTLWRRLDDAPDPDDVRPWLYGVARRVILNQNRSANRRSRLGAKLHTSLVEMNDEFEERAVTGVAVRAVLERLDPSDQELLSLTSFEGCTTREISVVMGIPSSTVRTRLRRARMRFAKELAIVDGVGESGSPQPDMYQ